MVAVVVVAMGCGSSSADAVVSAKPALPPVPVPDIKTDPTGQAECNYADYEQSLGHHKTAEEYYRISVQKRNVSAHLKLAGVYMSGAGVE